MMERKIVLKEDIKKALEAVGVKPRTEYHGTYFYEQSWICLTAGRRL